MTDRARNRAFALVVALVGLVVVLPGFVGGDGAPTASPHSSRASAPAPERRGTVQDAAATPPSAVAATPASKPRQPEPVAGGEDANGEDARGGEAGDHGRVAPELVRRRAAAFARAFLRYEVGDLSPPVAQAIVRLADPALAANLLSNPPRPVLGMGNAAPPAGALVGLGEVLPGVDGGFETVEIVRRGTQKSALTLTLQRQGKAWLVTAVG